MKRGSSLREFPILVIVALAVSLLIKTFLVQFFYIPSGSMENTLQIQDRVAVY
jgi:signal peptidase I